MAICSSSADIQGHAEIFVRLRIAMAPGTIRILLSLSLIAITQACLCPLPPGGQDLFQYAYQQAGTVVKAKVIKQVIDAPCPSPPCLCKKAPCPANVGLEGKRIYTLRLHRTFKGTPPPRKFTAETVLDTVRCGISLNVGTVYMLNMAGRNPYFLWLCQFSKPWAQVTKEQRRFLWKCKQPHPPSICTKGPVFVPTLPPPTLSSPTLSSS